MPDGDVYSRHIPRGWQTAAKFVFTGQDDAVSLPKLFRALGQMVKQGGCPGINEIAAVVEDALMSPRLTSNQQMKRELEQIKRRYASDRTTIASDVARRIVASPADWFPDSSRLRDPERVRLTVVRAVLIELVMTQISSTALQTSLMNSGDVTFHEYWQRQRHFKRLLFDSPHIGELAGEVFRNPEGDGIKVPQIRSPKLTPEEFITFPLTG